MTVGSIDVTAQAFQALWYFTLLLICMAIAMFVAIGFVVAGARRLWINGQRPHALILTTVVSVTGLIFTGFGLAAIIGLALGGPN